RVYRSAFEKQPGENRPRLRLFLSGDLPDTGRQPRSASRAGKYSLQVQWHSTDLDLLRFRTCADEKTPSRAIPTQMPTQLTPKEPTPASSADATGLKTQGSNRRRQTTNQKVGCSNHSGRTIKSIT